MRVRLVNFLKERSLLWNKDIKKDCGCSLFELKNMVYSFVSGDRFISGFDFFCIWLRSIIGNIKMFNLNKIFFIYEEDEEEILGLYSEKFVLVFVFVIIYFKVKCIRIVKNFRICDECYYLVEYIFLLYGYEILLSDIKCLYYIENGYCFCGDYW